MPRAHNIDVFLFGSFRIVVRGQLLPEEAWRRRKARQLFKYLFTTQKKRAHKEELAELLWPDSAPEAASTNLRTTVHAIRQALDSLGPGISDELIVGGRDGVGLRVGVDVWVDAEEFENLLRQAQHAANPMPLLQQADELYSGDYLADDLYEDWATERREALKHAWTELQFRIARLAHESGDVESLASAMDRLLRADPCNERAAHDLMRALLEQGRRSDALRVYQRLAQALREDLDVEPSDELVALRDRAQGSDSSQGSEAGFSVFRCSYPFPSPARLIGREAELGRLRRLLSRGRRSGELAFVAAPAGTGKSALIGALVREAQEGGVLCLAGGCYEERGMVPLGPIHDALADYLLAQPPDRTRAELGGGASDLVAVVPELRHHLDLPESEPLDPPRERMRQFGAVLSCLRNLTSRQPVLMCLEDLHAADAATVHLLHYLVRQGRRLPLTIIATFRVEEEDIAGPLAQVLGAVVQERLAEQVVLAPLDAVATKHLVAGLLGAPPEASLAEWLYSTAEGNPLFVEQLVFALGENGQFEHGSGVWQAFTQPGEILPAVLRDVIRQRLQHLRTSTREVLSMGAVLGQAFDYAVLLASLEPEDEGAVLSDLEQAFEAHLIRETASGYAFSHALLHQAMYWSISGPRRMRLHARAGLVLERLATGRGAQVASELARHFASGGRSAAMRAKALQYGLQAGRRAAGLSSHREALAEFRQLSAVIEGDPDVESSTRLAVLGGRGRAELELAMWPECIETFKQVVALAEDAIERARARGAIAYALHHTDRASEALSEVDLGLLDLAAVAQSRAALDARLELQLEKALHLFLLGRFRDQLDLGRDMLAHAQPLDEPRPLAQAHTATGGAFSGLGHMGEALKHFELARMAAERADDKVRIAIAQENLGLGYYRTGQFGVSREHLEAALQLYRETSAWQFETGTGSRAINALQALGRVALAEGNLAEARTHAETACVLATRVQDRWAAECHHLLGSIYSLESQWAEAEDRFTKALAIRNRVGHAAGSVESLLGLGSIYERRGQWDDARRMYAHAREVASQMDVCPQTVAAARQLGRLLLRGPWQRESADTLEEAVATAETMPLTLEYAPTLLALAELYAMRANFDEALALLERAAELPGTAAFEVERRATLAQLLAVCGRASLSRVRAAEAVAEAERLGSEYLLGLAHLASASAWAAPGDAANHTRALRTAQQHFQTANVPFEAARRWFESAVLDRRLAGQSS